LPLEAQGDMTRLLKHSYSLSFKYPNSTTNFVESPPARQKRGREDSAVTLAYPAAGGDEEWGYPSGKKRRIKSLGPAGLVGGGWGGGVACGGRDDHTPELGEVMETTRGGGKTALLEELTWGVYGDNHEVGNFKK